MKAWIAAVLCLGVVFAAPSPAQEKKRPAAAQKKQDQRLRDCGARAGKRTGRERQSFMTACLKGAKPRPRKSKR
jgi:hypothetical protein